MCYAAWAEVAAAAVAATSAAAAGHAQSQSANYQAQVAKNNAVIAQQNAAHAAQVGARDAETQGLKDRSRVAMVRAGFAANNLDATGGSPADVIGGEKQSAILDQETVSNNAALQVYGYQAQGGSFTGQAALDTAEAGDAATAGGLKAGGSLISALPDLPDTFSWMQGNGGGAPTSNKDFP